MTCTTPTNLARHNKMGTSALFPWFFCKAVDLETWVTVRTSPFSQLCFPQQGNTAGECLHEVEVCKNLYSSLMFGLTIRLGSPVYGRFQCFDLRNAPNRKLAGRLQEVMPGRATLGSLNFLSIYGSDVFYSDPPDTKCPLLSAPNVVMTPHIGGSARRTSFALGTLWW
jgi:hypothetical protein